VALLVEELAVDEVVPVVVDGDEVVLDVVVVGPLEVVVEVLLPPPSPWPPPLFAELDADDPPLGLLLVVVLWPAPVEDVDRAGAELAPLLPPPIGTAGVVVVPDAPFPEPPGFVATALDVCVPVTPPSSVAKVASGKEHPPAATAATTNGDRVETTANRAARRVMIQNFPATATPFGVTVTSPLGERPCPRTKRTAPVATPPAPAPRRTLAAAVAPFPREYAGLRSSGHSVCVLQRPSS
jgi:hypothetical protein